MQAITFFVTLVRHNMNRITKYRGRCAPREEDATEKGKKGHVYSHRHENYDIYKKFRVHQPNPSLHEATKKVHGSAP